MNEEEKRLMPQVTALLQEVGGAGITYNELRTGVCSAGTGR